MFDGFKSRWMIALLVGVLHRLADRHEQLQPLARRQLGIVAIFVMRHALDQLHHKIGAAVVADAGIENLGDVGMVHQGQRLPLLLEAGQHTSESRPGRMTLTAMRRCTGAVWSATQTSPMPPSPSFWRSLIAAGENAARLESRRGGLQGRLVLEGDGAYHFTASRQFAGIVVSANQHFDAAAQFRIARTEPIQDCGAFLGLGRDGFQKGGLNLFGVDRHGYLRFGASQEHA